MTEKATKAEAKISTLSELVGTTEDGDIWLKDALDPFTDTPRRNAGFPDMIVGNSVVQCITKSTTVTFTSPTDVHIFLDNIEKEVELSQNQKYQEGGIYFENNWLYANNTVGRRGGVRIRSASSGPTARTTQPNDIGSTLVLDANYFDGGRTRIISKGFEVHNTTPKINAGGSVAVYCDSTTDGYNPSGVGVIRNSGAGLQYNSNSYPLYPLAKVPETLSEVLLIPGSQQWDAVSGAMVVAKMNRQTNDAFDDVVGMVKASDSSNTANNEYITRTKSAGGNVVPYVDQGVAPSPFFVSGAYFTGLPGSADKPQSLTITAKWIIERFIDQTNKDLITMATPSPCYDPVAQMLYAKTAQKLPAGTKVKNNADGDWIKNIADVLGNFGVPGMGFVKGAVDLWNGASAALTPKQQSQEDKRMDQMADILKTLTIRTEQNSKAIQGGNQPSNFFGNKNNLRLPPPPKIPVNQGKKKRKRPTAAQRKANKLKRLEALANVV